MDKQTIAISKQNWTISVQSYPVLGLMFALMATFEHGWVRWVSICSFGVVTISFPCPKIEFGWSGARWSRPGRWPEKHRL